MIEKQLKIIVNSIVIIFVIIGAIFISMMVSDLIDFVLVLEELRLFYNIPYDVFYNNHEISSLISKGYWIITKDRLIVFVPLFIIAIIIKVSGNKIIKNREF